MSAAKRRTSLLVLLASALVSCVSAPASGHSALHLETRAELLAEDGRNSVERPGLTREIVSRYYDPLREVASGFSVAPRKAVNLPSAKKINIDMDHIASGHMRGGSRVSPNKDLFPANWSRTQVQRAVKDAYKSAKRIRTQGDRVLVRGTVNGKTIEMWINKVTKTIETAYPIGW